MTLSNNNKKINFLLKKANNNLVKNIQKLNLISAGNIIEYPIEAIKLLKAIAKKINKFDGGLLTFDYGYTTIKNKNTLQSIKKHKHVNIFYKPGLSDITSHLNFKLFYEILKKNNLNVKKIIGGKGPHSSHPLKPIIWKYPKRPNKLAILILQTKNKLRNKNMVQYSLQEILAIARSAAIILILLNHIERQPIYILIRNLPYTTIRSIKP